MPDKTELPVASVLMPVHNCARFLAEAIDSILNQSFSQFEFIIIDDGSTDGSADLLTNYAHRDPRIRLLTNRENRGIVSSLNQGLRACQGTYIVRMDADDIAAPNRLEKQIAGLEADASIAALGSAVSYIDAAGHEIGRIRASEPDRSPLRANPMLHPTVVMRRDIIEKHALCYREKYRFAEDYFLWLEMNRFGKLDALEDILLKYRLSSSATRFTRLKGVLWATLKTKKDAVFTLGLRPTFADVQRFVLECCLMLMPSALIRWMYFRFVLRIKAELT